MNIEGLPAGQRRVDGGDYRLGVRDFGPIERADVEFRPLTVFVGPSNTGKSYVATLSYALHRYFTTETDPYLWGVRRIPGALDPYFLRRGPDEGSAIEPPGELASWASTASETDDLPPLPRSVAEAVRDEIVRSKRIVPALGAEILRSFGSDGITELVRRSGAGVAEVAIAPSEPLGLGLLDYRLRMADGELEIEANASGSVDPLPGIGPSREAERWKHLLRREAHRYQEMESDPSIADRHRALHLMRIVGLLVEAARHSALEPLRRLAYYLPADRTGIMHSHKMVVAALVQSAARAGLRQTPDVPTLSGVLTDFLEMLIEMGDRNGPRGRRIVDNVASRLEKRVLGGTVRVESSDTNYPQFLYRPEGWSSDLALMRSSSMVSELAPLVLYLRHVVGRGEVLIVEEPESHLHPAMQVEVIGWVARMVRAGVRVILTTHSEWVLDALANTVAASGVADAGGGTRDLVPALGPEEVGVWRFSPRPAPRGVVIEEIALDEDGMYPSGFDEVAVGIHNRWAELKSCGGAPG